MLQQFLKHRVIVIRKRTEHQVREAKKRTHILEGQLIATSSLDEVIAICRGAPSRAEAKSRLQNLEVTAAVLSRALGAEHFASLQSEIGVQASYRMTEQQADAVVRLQLGQLAALERDEFIADRCNWIPFDQPPGTLEVTVKIRYHHPGAAATVTPLPKGGAKVKLHAPQRAITPGQAAVFYQEDLVLGGGWIAR